jgi:hypothetical protein
MTKTMHRIGLALGIASACGDVEDDGDNTAAGDTSSSSGGDEKTTAATTASAETSTTTTAAEEESESSAANESSSEGGDESSSDDTGGGVDPNYPPSDPGPCPRGYVSSPSIGNVCLAPCMVADDPIEACVQPLSGTGPAACGLVSMMSSLTPCETLGEPCENGEVCLMVDEMPDPVCSAVPDFCGIICTLGEMQFTCPDGMQCNDSNGLCVYP